VDLANHGARLDNVVDVGANDETSGGRRNQPVQRAFDAHFGDGIAGAKHIPVAEQPSLEDAFGQHST
jgi:hypothetical protein